MQDASLGDDEDEDNVQYWGFKLFDEDGDDGVSRRAPTSRLDPDIGPPTSTCINTLRPMAS